MARYSSWDRNRSSWWGIKKRKDCYPTDWGKVWFWLLKMSRVSSMTMLFLSTFFHRQGILTSGDCSNALTSRLNKSKRNNMKLGSNLAKMSRGTISKMIKVFSDLSTGMTTCQISLKETGNFTTKFPKLLTAEISKAKTSSSSTNSWLNSKFYTQPSPEQEKPLSFMNPTFPNSSKDSGSDSKWSEKSTMKITTQSKINSISTEESIRTSPLKMRKKLGSRKVSSGMSEKTTNKRFGALETSMTWKLQKEFKQRWSPMKLQLKWEESETNWKTQTTFQNKNLKSRRKWLNQQNPESMKNSLKLEKCLNKLKE